MSVKLAPIRWRIASFVATSVPHKKTKHTVQSFRDTTMVAIAPTPKIKNLDKLLMHCQRRRYAAKSNIICAGDRSETLFFIIKGSVTILIEDDDGLSLIHI